MERKFLEELGIEKEVADKIMAEHGKVKNAREQAEKDRDGLKTQLSEVSEKLKTFDGVDVDALKGEIETLKKDMTAKEADYSAELSERDFKAMLTAEVMAAGCKNPKAVMALLDLESLKGSKNQKNDAEAAIKALQASDAYLFSNTDSDTPSKVSTGGEHNDGGGGVPPSTNAQMNALIKGELKGD